LRKRYWGGYWILGRESDNIRKLQTLYCLLHPVRIVKSRRMRWASYIAHMEVLIYECIVQVGKSEGKIPLRRSMGDGKI
jgi:hypothetical protein